MRGIISVDYASPFSELNTTVQKTIPCHDKIWPCDLVYISISIRRVSIRFNQFIDSLNISISLINWFSIGRYKWLLVVVISATIEIQIDVVLPSQDPLENHSKTSAFIDTCWAWHHQHLTPLLTNNAFLLIMGQDVLTKGLIQNLWLEYGIIVFRHTFISVKGTNISQI